MTAAPSRAVTAERTVRAALGELARFVMVAEDTDQALEVAARANEIVVQAIGWALADGRPRAAVDLAEAGRGLILASVTLSGRVETVPAERWQPDAADAWRTGGRAARATALGALWESTAGNSLLSTPTSDEVSVALARTRLDAVVYLVPPAGPDSAAEPAHPDPTGGRELAGHALVVRPVLGEVEVIPLPGLAGAGHRTPLDAYLTALNVALDGYDPAAGNPDGFRAGPLGRAWADALDRPRPVGVPAHHGAPGGPRPGLVARPPAAPGADPARRSGRDPVRGGMDGRWLAGRPAALRAR